MASVQCQRWCMICNTELETCKSYIKLNSARTIHTELTATLASIVGEAIHNNPSDYLCQKCELKTRKVSGLEHLQIKLKALYNETASKHSTTTSSVTSEFWGPKPPGTETSTLTPAEKKQKRPADSPGPGTPMSKLPHLDREGSDVCIRTQEDGKAPQLHLPFDNAKNMDDRQCTTPLMLSETPEDTGLPYPQELIKEEGVIELEVVIKQEPEDCVSDGLCSNSPSFSSQSPSPTALVSRDSSLATLPSLRNAATHTASLHTDSDPTLFIKQEVSYEETNGILHIDEPESSSPPVQEFAACEGCHAKDRELEHLRDELAMVNEENSRLWEQIQELQARSNAFGPNHHAMPPDGAEYQPSRGPKILKCRYVCLTEGEPCPSGYCQLENTRIAVPEGWLTDYLLKLEEKKATEGEKVKRIFDAFFEPKDMAYQNSTKMAAAYPVLMEAIRLFCLNKVKVTSSKFTAYTNQKCDTMKRAFLKSQKH